LPVNDLLAADVLQTEKAPAVAGAFLISSFNYIGLTITKNRFGESFILLMGLELLVFWWVGGLDMRFC
jgi:hypothetical protein